MFIILIYFIIRNKELKIFVFWTKFLESDGSSLYLENIVSSSTASLIQPTTSILQESPEAKFRRRLSGGALLNLNPIS